MLSIAAASSTSFAAPSAMAVRSARTNVMMQEAAPVEEVVVPPFDSKKFAESLPGITGPLGFFDPLGFCTSGEEKVSEAKIRFYREVELKHARVAMLAAVGFPLAEQFHPLFATDDAPSFLAFQQTPLQTFWPIVVLAIAIPEVFSTFSFEKPSEQAWAMKADHVSGDYFGFDPLGLKPSNAAELKEMQTKEINNGRLAMIAIAGMVGQELATGNKLF
jgi:hypothetical protein